MTKKESFQRVGGFADAINTTLNQFEAGEIDEVKLQEEVRKMTVGISHHVRKLRESFEPSELDVEIEVNPIE